MKGTIYPRPAKRVTDKKGRERLAPLRPGEEWTDPTTGRTVKAGPSGSTWSYQLTTGTKRTGRKHHSRGGFATRKACEAALAEVVAALGRGDRRPLVKRTDQTVGEHLDEWLAQCQVRARRPLKPSTAAGYGNAIKVWIKPHIGDVPLADLDRDHLVALYAKLRDRGGKGRKVVKPAPRSPDGSRVTGDPSHTYETRPLGSRSVQLAHTILTKALASAVADDKIPVSPIERIHPDHRPTHTPRKLADRHWSPEQARTFLAHVAEGRLHPLWALALDTGARRGELAALRWSDVDLDDGRVTIARNRVMVGAQVVEGTPKSAKSHRRVDIDAGTVTVLKRWKATQMRERMAAGPAWAGGDDPYLFTDELGEPYRPDGLSDRFDKAQSGAGVPALTFHGLRHTSATLALSAKPVPVPIHVVSERLGHATVSITADIYAHVLEDQRTDAAQRIGGALYGTGGPS
jgi:integrase